ncbi:hypothetical protein HON22_03895, partial [Candidatus Peregrinibacteria bacterium]|nr:hypothetical protein [Candidatus Peregrinibacteria bacterium]
MKKTLLIIGSYGASNIGDEAILEVMIKNLSKDWNLGVLSGNVDDTCLRHGKSLGFCHSREGGNPTSSKVVNNHKLERSFDKLRMTNGDLAIAPHFPFGFKSLLSFSWLKSYKLLFKSDLVLLGGGGLFTDDYTIRAPMLWAWHIFWCRVFQKPVVLFANSVGPLKTSLGRKFAKLALNECEKIIVRDEISVNNVKKLLPEKEVIFGTDIVFSYNNIHKSIIRDDLCHSREGGNPSSKNSHKKTLALNLRDWNMSFHLFPQFIELYIKNGYKVLLLPMEKDDERVLGDVYKKIKNSSSVMMVVPQNYRELISILTTCEKAIGMRLHFLIAAAISGCMLSGISYSSKVQGILEQVKIPYVLPKDISENTLKKLFADAKKAENLDKQ